MTEEDTFLTSIAADRADRTRLLVFADWLADHADPREAFVRVHARLLDMDGTEPEFPEYEKVWNLWIRGHPSPKVQHPRIYDRWLDALVRVCTIADIDQYAHNALDREPMASEMLEFETVDHTDTGSEPNLNLYHGRPRDYLGPFDFVGHTLLVDLWEDPFLARGIRAIDECYPITAGSFWKQWRDHVRQLREPPPLPVIARDNLFLGAQYIAGGWDNWGLVATYQHDYFALFWSTTA